MDFVGKTYWRLTVIGQAGRVLTCQCTCGEKKVIDASQFKQAKSCGCLRVAVMKRIGPRNLRRGGKMGNGYHSDLIDADWDT